MEEEKKGEIKAIYSELRGYLAEAPIQRGNYYEIDDYSVWKHYNGTVDLLNKISGKNYSRHCIEPSFHSSSHNPYVTIDTYRQKLNGLISKLREEYFPDEPNPLDGAPSTVITQSQQQVQTVQMVLDVQSKIDEKISSCQEGSNEKNFLQKLKSSLSSISNVNQLLRTVCKLAKDYGLNFDEVLKIFT